MALTLNSKLNIYLISLSTKIIEFLNVSISEKLNIKSILKFCDRIKSTRCLLDKSRIRWSELQAEIENNISAQKIMAEDIKSLRH